MSKVQIRITSKRDGFRRAGRSHSRTPTIYEANAFTKEELEVLRAEPMLTVEGIVAEEKEQSPPPPPENTGANGDASTDASNDGENGKEVPDIVTAILGLDKADKKLWTASGAPHVRAIEAAIGRQITADERDAAWEAIPEGDRPKQE